MPIKNRLADIADEATAWRRDLHAHPELGFDLDRTTARVAGLLGDFGCDSVVEGVGVIGLIKGNKGPGPVVGLRADMDALPIREATGVAHASTIAGKMHGCGHDGHTAMLLGAAKYLAETRNFAGTVALIFQPAEEIAKGAQAMVDEGVFDRFAIEEVYGMHNRPGLAVGEFIIRSGPYFAAVDTFEIVVSGKGGHAARPNSAIDPVVAASNIVMALQTVASRNVNPVKTIVVSVTSFRSETEAFNVIPASVTLRGTVRTFEAEVRELAEARLKAIAQHAAEVYGATAAVEWFRNCSAMVNADEQTEIARAAAEKVTGRAPGLADLVMGGEDFAFMLEARPGAYIQIGNGDTAEVHHPAYDFNDEAISAGASYWVELVEHRLAAQRGQ